MNLGIDFSNVQTLSENTVLPEGNYLFSIVFSEIRESQNGNRYLSFTYKVMEGEYNGVTIFDNFNLWNTNSLSAEIAQRKLKTLASVAGHPSPNNIRDTEEFYGLSFIGSVIVKEYNGKQSNNVKAYRPAPKVVYQQQEIKEVANHSYMDDVPF